MEVWNSVIVVALVRRKANCVRFVSEMCDSTLLNYHRQSSLKKEFGKALTLNYRGATVN